MFLDKMDVEEVKGIVRSSLGLDSDVVIDNDVRIAELGAVELGTGGIDLANILFRAEACIAENFSSGEVNEQGREFLMKVGKFFGMPYYCHFASLSIISSRDIFNRLTPMDVSLMAKYREYKKRYVA